MPIIIHNLPEGCPKTSPWGAVQTAVRYADGVYSVSTAGHGGIKLDRDHNAKVPAAFRRPGGWYEEDCDWAIPVTFHPSLFEPHLVEAARRSIRDWQWREWEAHFGEELPASESHCKAEHLFLEAHRGSWLTISAFGDWHEKVPAGMVGVIATLGGRQPGYYKEAGAVGSAGHSPERRFFLVPAAEYRTRGENPAGTFVVDPAAHAAWCGPGR